MTHYFFRKLMAKATLTFNLKKTWKQLVNEIFRWKMLFNPDPVKQAIESHKQGQVVYPSLMFNNNDVQSANSQKHLGLVLDPKLAFNGHVNNK